MFNLIGDSEIAIKKANKKKLHELLDKYGSVGKLSEVAICKMLILLILQKLTAL